MIRFLSGKLKKHTKLAKIVKIGIFVNRLVFPVNFNRFSHPMTVTLYFRNYYNRAFKNDIFKNFEINFFFFNIPEPYHRLLFKTNDILTLDLVVNENY